MIGIIPAAGSATRIHGIPKMLLPVPDDTLMNVMRQRMGRCDQNRGYLTGVRPENYDLLAPYATSTILYKAETRTMTETVLMAQAYSIDGEWSLFGMPDSYVEDEQAFTKLVNVLHKRADVAVGVFRTRPEQTSKLGMCRVVGHQMVEVVDKPDETILEWAWGVLAWKPAFWQFLRAEDQHVGYALPRAIAAGCDVRAVFMDGGYWDCGTPDEYFALIRHLTGEKVLNATPD